MNGRIYDPLLGRFLSADVLVQSPNRLQSYNRYTYVMNNPLRLTDPTGYSWVDELTKKPKPEKETIWNRHRPNELDPRWIPALYAPENAKSESPSTPAETDVGSETPTPSGTGELNDEVPSKEPSARRGDLRWTIESKVHSARLSGQDLDTAKMVFGVFLEVAEEVSDEIGDKLPKGSPGRIVADYYEEMFETAGYALEGVEQIEELVSGQAPFVGYFNVTLEVYNGDSWEVLETTKREFATDHHNPGGMNFFYTIDEAAAGTAESIRNRQIRMERKHSNYINNLLGFGEGYEKY